jgi:hypothetical protein
MNEKTMRLSFGFPDYPQLNDLKPMPADAFAVMTDGETTIELPDAEPDPKTAPHQWLAWQVNKALMKLLSDPRPLITGSDGKLHYVEAEGPKP